MCGSTCKDTIAGSGDIWCPFMPKRKQTFLSIVTLLPFPCQRDFAHIHAVNFNCIDTFSWTTVYRVHVLGCPALHPVFCFGVQLKWK